MKNKAQTDINIHVFPGEEQMETVIKALGGGDSFPRAL
jgi:hypothetical protein